MNENNPVWYPFTHLKISDEPIKISRGEGAYLYDDQGNAFFDAVSSWWVNLYGHRHPAIVDAIKNQLDSLDHVLFADFTHNPAEELAKKLLEINNHCFSKVFFSDNGSTAVEVAIKLSLQYYSNLYGQKRSKIIAFTNSYHGDTFGAMSAGARSVFSEPFSHLFFDVQRFDYPSTWIGDVTVEKKENVIITSIRKYIEENNDDIACLIIEPLVQGAGGMNMCRPDFLQKLDLICKEFKVLVIYDEIMTGFGRTGEVFAYQKAKTNPDMICLSKGITGGFLPLSVTLTSQNIFKAFYSDDKTHTFFHGHSYTANPISCSAAIASTNLIKSFENDRKRIELFYKSRIDQLLNFDLIEKVRVSGTILAFDIKSTNNSNYLNPIGLELKKKMLKKGYLLRPLGNTVYIMPTYVSTNKVLGQLLDDLVNFIRSFYMAEQCS